MAEPWRRRSTIMLLRAAVAASLGCSAKSEPPRVAPPQVESPPPPLTPRASASAVEAPRPPHESAPEKRLEPDGNDEAVNTFELPAAAHFEKVGRHWAALTRVCAFAVHGGALFMAHATQPLGLGGASITRYTPETKPPFSLAFDWNRPGEPERGGGAGQGILRVRSIDGRLYAPDADPPYLGLGLATGIEGYVFVSDAQGAFARARMPGHVPPRPATAERAGVAVLPGTLHGFDVIRFRGKLYASTSSAIPPNGNAKTSPGTLLTPDADGKPWRVAFTYAGAPGEDSVRLGYMTRFRDRLYVAISPLYGLDRNDFIIIAPPLERGELQPEDGRPARVSRTGGSHTLRWYTDRDTLYWISLDAEGAHLRASTDGDHFRELRLLEDAGAPSDILRVGGRLLVLAEGGLFTVEGETIAPYANPPEGKGALKVDDGYCAAPLVGFGGSLYTGDQTRGNLWKLVAD